jgi:hypothetical protein
MWERVERKQLLRMDERDRYGKRGTEWKEKGLGDRKKDGFFFGIVIF